MRGVVGYGIDYGTSNSSIAAAYDDGTVEVLGVDRAGGTLLRSLVSLNRDGTRLAGDESVQAYLVEGGRQTRCGRCELVDRTATGIFTDCRQYRSGSGCQDSRLLAQVKTDLSSETFTGTHSWARDHTVTDLVAVVLRRLKREADRRTGQDVRRLALGRPVRFPGVEMDPDVLQPLAEARLLAAGTAAGFDEVVLVPEPQAAVAVEDIADGIVLCTDFGGGTFDVAVLEKNAGHGDVLALRGVAVGGESFDSKLFDLKMQDALGLRQTVVGPDGKPLGLPNWVRQEFRSLAGLKRLLTDNDVAILLRSLAAREGGDFAEALNELLYGGQAYACYRAVEQAKIDLSMHEEATIELRRPPYLNVTATVTRREFETLIKHDLDTVRFCIEDVLDDAGVRSEDVAVVTRTGGSSQIPAFVTVLEDFFGAAPLVERDAFSTVVRGLASYAYGEWETSRD